MAAGFSRSPVKPAGCSPHSLKLGICLTKSALPEQRYKRTPLLRRLLGEGSPVKTLSTVYNTSGAKSSS